MSNVLRGNFQTKTAVTAEQPAPADEGIEARFEREALKRLGGSIAFVAKKKVVWDSAEPRSPAPSERKADE